MVNVYGAVRVIVIARVHPIQNVEQRSYTDSQIKRNERMNEGAMILSTFENRLRAGLV